MATGIPATAAQNMENQLIVLVPRVLMGVN